MTIAVVKRLRYVLVTLLLLGCMIPEAMAQRPKIQNLQQFDNRRFHFGFTLGYNRTNFIMEQKANYSFEDSILSVQPYRQPGFNLGIVSELHISKNWGLRFVPALSFQDRSLQYVFLESDGGTTFVEKRVESTFLDFPLTFKYRTDRVNNFAAYAVAGGKYSIDMASQQDVNQSLGTDAILKINRHDYSWEAGIGFDFFLQYFKFGLEFRSSFGLRNVLIQDNSIYSSPLESLRTKGFLISFTFEG